MKAFRITIIFSTLVFSLFTPGCVPKDKSGVDKALQEYWQNVFEGNSREAYRMLSKGSRKSTTLEAFAEQIAYGLDKTPLKDSFFAVYAPLCKLSMGPVKIEGDTASAAVIITYPHMPSLEEYFAKKADSLFTPVDSTARKDWMMREKIKDLTDHQYMTMIWQPNLKLHWEGFGWRIVYGETGEGEEK